MLSFLLLKLQRFDFQNIRVIFSENIVFYPINVFLCRQFNQLNIKNMSDIRAKVVSIIVDKLGVDRKSVV